MLCQQASCFACDSSVPVLHLCIPLRVSATHSNHHLRSCRRDAARVYLKHNGTARFGPGTPPVTLMFADSLPANSKKLAAAAAEASNYVWATRDAVGDAESISEDLKTAGLRLDHVHR